MPQRTPADGRATDELFRLRRSSIVDTCGYLGFLIAFALAGIYSFRRLYIDVSFVADAAMFRYIVTTFVAGLGGGAFGMACGHLLATAWERVDLVWHPRRYERGSGGE